MIKMKLGELSIVRQLRSGVRVGKALTFDEIEKRLEAKYEGRSVRRDCRAQKLLLIARGKMACLKYPVVSDEELLFERIESWVNREGWLPGSYKYMLSMLIQGKRYEEIIPSCHALF